MGIGDGRNGSCRAGEDLTRRESVFNKSASAGWINHACAGTHDTSHRNGPTGDVLTPEAENQCESSNFEGDQKRFVDEEVPAGHKAHGVVDEVTSQANESTRDRIMNSHLGDAVVYQS